MGVKCKFNDIKRSTHTNIANKSACVIPPNFILLDYKTSY